MKVLDVLLVGGGQFQLKNKRWEDTRVLHHLYHRQHTLPQCTVMGLDQDPFTPGHGTIRHDCASLGWSLPSPHISCLLSNSSLDPAPCISRKSSLWKSDVCSPSAALHALFQVSLWLTVTQSDRSIPQALEADHGQGRPASPSSGTRAEQTLLPPDSVFSSTSVFWLESMSLPKIDLLGGQHEALTSCCG